MSNQKTNFTSAIVTGARGFLGRVLTERLSSYGVKVFAVEADITDRAALEATPWTPEGESVLFHLAALSQTSECTENPERADVVNHLGALNAARAFLKKGVRRVVFPSTGLVYGSSSKERFSESDPASPTGVYAESKFKAESALKALADETGISCVVARLGNIYGPDASPNSVCAILLRQVLQNEPLRVQTPRPVRDFIYVQDVVTGLVRLAEHQTRDRFDLFNLATGVGTSIEGLAKTICRLMGKDPKLQANHPDQEGTPPRLVLDSSKMTRELGWSIHWPLESGLRDTITRMKR